MRIAIAADHGGVGLTDELAARLRDAGHDVADLGTDAMQVLVMIDGNTSLRNLRTLVPHIDEARFNDIVGESVGRGLVSFS